MCEIGDQVAKLAAELAQLYDAGNAVTSSQGAVAAMADHVAHLDQAHQQTQLKMTAVLDTLHGVASQLQTVSQQVQVLLPRGAGMVPPR